MQIYRYIYIYVCVVMRMEPVDVKPGGAGRSFGFCCSGLVGFTRY